MHSFLEGHNRRLLQRPGRDAFKKEGRRMRLPPRPAVRSDSIRCPVTRGFDYTRLRHFVLDGNESRFKGFVEFLSTHKPKHATRAAAEAKTQGSIL